MVFRKKPRAGFTLLEVLVAVSVIAMILSIVYSTFARTVESKEYVELGNDAYHRARWAMDKITMDLASAFVNPGRETNTLFLALSHDVNGMPMDELHFTSFAHVQLNPNAAESDQAEISYKVAYVSELEKFQLWRREDAIIDAEPMTGGEELVLVDDLIAFNVRLYDGTAWTDQWDSRPYDLIADAEGGEPQEAEVFQTDEMIKAAPAAAEVTIAVRGPDIRPIIFTSKIKIELSAIDLTAEDEGEAGEEGETGEEDGQGGAASGGIDAAPRKPGIKGGGFVGGG
ncbi:MAG: prepilin-type N-terminal cleavage/methylation domain-containing protein [Deltaproteobacteria bacterium]|nr:prepilin-type N-terminal cleavage/methylation domain-containing protein [Deltaproteobacteria bacterium]